jgi:hypothetical protein
VRAGLARAQQQGAFYCAQLYCTGLNLIAIGCNVDLIYLKVLDMPLH